MVKISTIAVTLITALALSGCKSIPSYNIDSPDALSRHKACQAQAQAYINTHREDKLWRDHEYHRQYRICLKQQTA